MTATEASRVNPGASVWCYAHRSVSSRVLGRSSVRLAEARNAEFDMVDRSHAVGNVVLGFGSSARAWPGPTDTLGSLRRTPYVSEAVQLDAEHSRCRPYVRGRNRVSKHHVNKLRRQAW